MQKKAGVEHFGKQFRRTALKFRLSLNGFVLELRDVIRDVMYLCIQHLHRAYYCLVPGGVQKPVL